MAHQGGAKNVMPASTGCTARRARRQSCRKRDSAAAGRHRRRRGRADATVEQEPPKPARVSSAFVEHNIKYYQFRSSLEIRSSIEGICNKQLLCAGTVQKRIC